MELIIFPDAEAVVISHLKTVLPGTHISTKVPTPRPARLIKVTRVGGPKVRLNAESAMLVFECWEADTVKASDLARLAKAYVHAMAGENVAGNWVYKVTEVGGLAYNPDPESDYPRYQFTVSLDLRGETL